jgi:uncharacterized membrane protein YhfC
MQNIDPVALLGPIIYILFSAGVVVYWKSRRRLTAAVIVISAVAYFFAIGLKVVVQDLTYGWVVATFGATSLATGIYFGAQTSFFEVGLAYLVARWAVSKKQVEGRDGEGYGVALAFWENAVLLGALPLFNLAVVYAIIANGLMPQAEYQTIVNSEPGLFYSSTQLLFPTALGVLERVSSFVFHFSWGYLCVLAAYLGKKKYFLVALPMGLVDTLVPFAGDVSLWVFEATIFLLSLGSFFVAWTITKEDRRNGYAKVLTAGTPMESA